MAMFDHTRATASAESLGHLYFHPNGLGLIHNWLKKSNFPSAHRYAAGMPGVKRKDLIKMVGKNKEKAGEVLDAVYWGCTPMDLAMACGDNHKVLEELIRMGADPNNKGGLKIDSVQDQTHVFDGRSCSVLACVIHGSLFGKKCLNYAL